MENSAKALIMGASVLMFLIAVSVAVYTYSTVINTTNSILTSSEKFAKSAEYFNNGKIDVTREISAAEVVGNILNIKSSNGYTFKEIVVGGTSFTADNIKSKNTAIRSILNSNKKYFISSIDYNNLKITYEIY